MFLCKDEVLKILEVMDKFPDANTFQLEQDASSGIGSITTLSVFTSINGVEGEFKTEISGVENW
jgi:hypothetical protein